MSGQGIDKGELHDITKMVARIDGSKLYSLLLWKLPSGKELDDTNPEEEANEYIQCAGSAERMTVEVRRIVSGKVEHYVVGRPPNGANRSPEETIRWGGHDIAVHANEVFTAREAAELFLSYYRTEWIPVAYALRPILT